MKGLREFSIEIPQRNIVMLPSRVKPLIRAYTLMVCHQLGYRTGEVHWQEYQVFDKHVLLVEGRLPPLVVLLFMALAQGHSLVALLDKMENELTSAA